MIILKISFFWLGQKSAIMDLAKYDNFPKGEKLSYNRFENYNISWSHFNQNLTWVQICKVMQKICIIPPDYGGKSLQESQDAYIAMTWSVILENGLHKCINLLEVLFRNKGVMDHPTERGVARKGDGSRKGVLDPERCWVEHKTIQQNKRLQSW